MPEELPEIPTDLITPKEAAALIGCHHTTIYRRIWDGELRAWKRCGTRLAVSKAEALKLLLAPVEPRARIHLEKEYDPAESPGHKAAVEALRKAGYRI